MWGEGGVEAARDGEDVDACRVHESAQRPPQRPLAC